MESHVTIAVRRPPSPERPAFVEAQLSLTPSTLKLLRFLSEDGAVLLWFHGDFHRIITITDNGTFLVKKERFEPEDTLPLVMLVDRADPQPHEPRRAAIQTIG